MTDLLGPRLQQALTCANDALTDSGFPVNLASVWPGTEVAFDDCCRGQVWVRVISAFPSGYPFPAPDSAARPCDIAIMGVRLGIGVIRCAHVVDNNGRPPTPEQITEDALVMTRDMATLQQAIICCMPDIFSILKIDTWTPQADEGGCMGGEWQVLVGLDVCGCP